MRRFASAVALVTVVTSPAAAISGLCGAASTAAHGPRVAVLSAFPAELAPLVTAASITEHVEVDGRTYDVGELEGVRVVLGLTGIGTVNAADRTTSVIRHFHPTAIVMSAVAGSRYRIGDVVVPAEWLEESTGRVFPVNVALRALVRQAAPTLPGPFQTCTPVPPTSPDGMIVCLPYEPAVVFGQRGQTEDPFNGKPFACTPGGGEIFGCELPMVRPEQVVTTAESEDMETAAVARVTTERHVPFVANRAVSDGAGDPLGDRGFPAQFLDYYRLSAANAALVTRAFLGHVHALAADRSGRATCRLLAAHRWKRVAARLDGASPTAR
jgi:nucleoside phosphorylase